MKKMDEHPASVNRLNLKLNFPKSEPFRILPGLLFRFEYLLCRPDDLVVHDRNYRLNHKTHDLANTRLGGKTFFVKVFVSIIYFGTIIDIFERDEGSELATSHTLWSVRGENVTKFLIHENVAIALDLPFEFRLLFKRLAGSVVAERNLFLLGEPTFLLIDGKSDTGTSGEYCYGSVDIVVDADVHNGSCGGTVGTPRPRAYVHYPLAGFRIGDDHFAVEVGVVGDDVDVLGELGWSHVELCWLV
jgi:hypothetical protein